MYTDKNKETKNKVIRTSSVPINYSLIVDTQWYRYEGEFLLDEM